MPESRSDKIALAEVEKESADHVQVGPGHELDLERSPGSSRVEVPLDVAFLSDLLRGASYGVRESRRDGVPGRQMSRRRVRGPAGGTGGDGTRELPDNSRIGKHGHTKAYRTRDRRGSASLFLFGRGVTRTPSVRPHATGSGTHPKHLARTRSSRYDVGVRCLRRREDEESGTGAELSDRAHREWSGGERCVVLGASVG